MDKTTRPKILLVVSSLAIGGQERIAANTAKCLSVKYDVTLLPVIPYETEYEKPCRVLYLDRKSYKGRIAKIFAQIVRAVKLARIRNKEKAVAIYSFGSTSNLTNILSAAFSRGKTIVSIHHGFAEAKKSYLDHLVYSRADAVVCVSKAMQMKLLQAYPQLKNTTVIENGYDIDEIDIKKKELLSLKKADIQFVAVGRLNRVKGFDRLLRAFKFVSQKLPQSCLLIVGDGPLDGELKQLAVSLNIQNQVIFTGYQKNPYRYLANSDIYVLSSHTEGFPNALIEALNCGLAIVSVDCQTGPREILNETFRIEPVQGIQYGDYGILTENSENEETTIRFLAQGMFEMAENKKRRLKYRELAKSRAYCYSLQVYQKKIEKLLQEIINE